MPKRDRLPFDILLTQSMLVLATTLSGAPYIRWIMALRIKWFYCDPIEFETSRLRIKLFTFIDAAQDDPLLMCQSLGHIEIATTHRDRPLQREQDYLYDMPRVF